MATKARTTQLIFVVLVLVSFAAAFWVPAQTSLAAAAGPVTLTITNPLPKATTVTIDGARDYTIYVPKGATITKTIDAGKYKYSYLGCLNKPKKGNLKVKGSAAALKIPACKTATWVFFNEDATKPATISLQGWMTYNVTLPPRTLVTFNWVADKYQVTVRACGKTYNESWNVKGKKGWVIYACK